MFFFAILVTIIFLCVQLEARMGNSSYDQKGYYPNLNFQDHRTRNPQQSRNPYENQLTYNTERRNGTHISKAPQNQTLHMSEGHQHDPYRTQPNTDRTIQTQYTSRSGAWAGHTDRNLQQGPNPNQNTNWKPVQNQNLDAGRRSSQYQDRYPGKQTQNLDIGRKDYYQALNSRQHQQNPNWGPVNRNQYNPQQNMPSYNPQHAINTLSAGVVPFIDPDLPDGLDDLWELQQKQAAVQHMLQTNPGLGTHVMVPGTISGGPPGQQFDRMNNARDTGGPGHVKVWTNPRSQNTSRAPWDQEHHRNIPYRSNMETEHIKREKIQKEGNKMNLHPSSFADVSNKFVENKMSIEEKKDLLGTSETYLLNAKQNSGPHPLVQSEPAPETKTTHLTTDTPGEGPSQTYRSRWYRKRGQNKNYRNMRTSTTAPPVIWNVSHRPSKLQYEQNSRHRYQSMINKQRTTTSPPHHLQDYHYGNRDRYYTQRYDERLPYQTEQTSQDKRLPYNIEQTRHDERLPYHTKETRYDERLPYQTEQTSHDKRLPYNIEQTRHDKRTETHDKHYLQNLSPDLKKQIKPDIRTGTYGQYSPWDLSPDHKEQKQANIKSSSALDPRQIPSLAEFSDRDNGQYRHQKNSRIIQSSYRDKINNNKHPAVDENMENENWRGGSHRTKTEHQFQNPVIPSQHRTHSSRNSESKNYLQYQQRRNLNPQSRDVEREQETETENENGRTSFSYSTEYRSNAGNPKINRDMLNEMIAERIKQRQMSHDKNHTMPWSPVPEKRSQPHRYQHNMKSNDTRQFYPPGSKGENYIRDHRNSRVSTDGFQHPDGNRHFLQESVDPGIERRLKQQNPGDRLNVERIHNKVSGNKTEIPAISGREVWTDPANQKEIEAGKLSPTFLDEIIDNFLLGGGDEIETPFGKIEREGNGGYEIDGPLLKLILYEIANKPTRHNIRSPEQLEHMRKFAGFDMSARITPAPVNKGSSTPGTSTPSTKLQDSTTANKKDVDERRQRIIWDSLPTFENPRTESKNLDTRPDRPTTSGRQIWDHMKPWDTVTWQPRLGQKSRQKTLNNENTGTRLSSQWEPVRPINSYNPVFESKIFSKMKNSSHQVKETRLVGAKSELSPNNIQTTVAMVTKQTTPTPFTISTGRIDIPVQNATSPAVWTKLLFDEPYNLKKKPPVSARRIMVPEEKIDILNKTKAQSEVETNTIKPTESSDSAFGIIFAIVAVMAVLVAPVLCIVWKTRKHFKEKKRKQLQADNFKTDKFEMETMISRDFGHCDDQEKDQGARRKTHFNKYQNTVHELQPLNSGRTSPNVIVHQEDEIY